MNWVHINIHKLYAFKYNISKHSMCSTIIATLLTKPSTAFAPNIAFSNFFTGQNLLILHYCFFKQYHSYLIIALVERL